MLRCLFKKKKKKLRKKKNPTSDAADVGVGGGVVREKGCDYGSDFSYFLGGNVNKTEDIRISLDLGLKQITLINAYQRHALMKQPSSLNYLSVKVLNSGPF